MTNTCVCCGAEIPEGRMVCPQCEVTTHRRKTMKKYQSAKVALLAFLLLALLVIAATLLTGCTEADKVNANLTQQADYFNCERRITVYNARTDTIILEAEGYMSISNNAANELVVTCKLGPETYKKNYIYLNSYTLYVVEDITGTHTDPYHYKLYFHTEQPFDVELVP